MTSAAAVVVPERVVPLRHPLRWLSAVVAVGLLVSLVVAVYGNKNIDHKTVSDYLFQKHILDGVEETIWLTIAAQLVGIVIGIGLAVMRLSANVVLRSVAWVYIWFFRGTPLLVQIILWGNMGALFEHLVLGVPFTDIYALRGSTNDIITASVAALVALGLNEGAYMAEIVRAGILSVDPGQGEAAKAVGMTGSQVMRKVVLPQAARVIVPPTGNEVQNMIKNTSLVSVIAGHDLLTNTQDIYSANLKVLALLTVCSFWYLVLSSVATVGQFYLERRFASGHLPLTPVQKLVALVGGGKQR